MIGIWYDDGFVFSDLDRILFWAKFWATVHDIIGKKKEGSAIPKVVINQDNQKVTNFANICNEFNKFSASVSPKMADRLPLSNFRFDHYMTDINQWESFFLQPVCKDEIRNLNNLDTHKATGPDDILVLVLKNCRLVIAPWLAKLINECFVLGAFQMFLR